MKKIISLYIIELIIGALLAYYDTRIFLVYFLLVFLVISYQQTNYLRKLIRVFNMSTEVKIMAIAKKVNVTKKDFQNIIDETKEKTNNEHWEKIEEEIGEVIDKI